MVIVRFIRYVCNFRTENSTVTKDPQIISSQLIAGNELAFDTVYKQYYRGLCAFATQYVTLSEAEEIVQDTMMWLWENRSALIPEMSLKSLLFTIVRNKCLNVINHQQIRIQVQEKLSATYRDKFEDPDFYMGELTELVAKAISELPEEYRKAFEMNRFDKLTYNEIAEKSGVSSKTIAYRISQALKILRTELKDYMPLALLFWDC